MIVLDPVVDGPNPATLATPLHGVAQFADASTAFDDVAPLGVFHQDVLHLAVLIIGQQLGNEAGKSRRVKVGVSMNSMLSILSANGG